MTSRIDSDGLTLHLSSEDEIAVLEDALVAARQWAHLAITYAERDNRRTESLAAARRVDICTAILARIGGLE